MCGARLVPLWSGIRIQDPPGAPIRHRDIAACVSCGSQFGTLPDGTGTSHYYAAKEWSDHEVLERADRRFIRVSNRVRRAIGRHSFSILDVGAAGGGHLTHYSDQVAKFAVEPSLSAKSSLAARGVQWLGPRLEDVRGHGTFDVVTALDVLEHVEDPLAMLAAMHDVLAPGGMLVVVTGNVGSFSARFAGRRWLYYALPEHCSFPSFKSLSKALVGTRGYHVVERTWIANEDISIRYVARFIVGIVVEAALRLAPATVAERCERSDRAIFPFFADSNLLLVLRKPRE